jgi:PAS domain S-box-containing protein
MIEQIKKFSMEQSKVNTQKPINTPSTELKRLRQRVTQLEKQAEQLTHTKHKLTERVKELSSLYSLALLSEDKSLTPDEYLQSVVDLIPPAYQRPEATWVRLTLNRQAFFSEGFQETKWQQSSTISVNGSPSGCLEVYTIHNEPDRRAPFFAEEQSLLDVLAKSIGQTLERKHHADTLEQIAWMLSQKTPANHLNYFPAYGDLSKLNEEGLIINAVAKDQLIDIASDYLDLLGTSAAIYERNGDYALGLFASDWCRMMDQASRELCQTENNTEALRGGHWHCHESCWKDASLQAIKTKGPVDVPCLGGIHLYAVPIYANDEVVGAINFGYGSPPKDEARLKALARQFGLPLEILRKEAHTYQARPQFIIDYAKTRLQKAADYLGVLVEYAQARKQLKASHDSLRGIIDASPLAIISLNPQGVVKTWNPAAEHIFGWTEGEAIGNFLPTVGEEEMAEFHTMLDGYQQEQNIIQRKFLRTRKDGTKIPIKLSTSFIKDERGNLERVIGIHEDITEEVAAERKNRQLLRQQLAIHELALTLGDTRELNTIYRAVHQQIRNVLGIDTIIIAFISKDQQSLGIDYVAYQGARIKTNGIPQISIENINYPLSNVIQKKHFQYFPDWQVIEHTTQKMCNTFLEQPPFNDLQGGIDKSGFMESLRSVVITPVKDEDEIIGMIQVSKLETNSFSADNLDFLTNIANITAISIQKVRLIETLEESVTARTSQLETALKKSERSHQAMLYMVEDLNQTTRELNSERENLARLNKELEAFSYSVSHDLRAPLRHINGYIDLLLKRFSENLPEKAHYYLNTVVDSANEMSEMINDLLHFSRTSRQDMHPTEIDMSALVNEVIENLKTDITKRSIIWEISNLPNAFGDRNLIKLVWNNLLSNAVKFTGTRAHAKIMVGTEDKRGKRVYYVKDNGVGFDMTYQEKLFGVFQRLHASADFEGTGIGLANVQRIIERHGGETWAEGTPDQGACFYFSLPKKGVLNEKA